MQRFRDRQEAGIALAKRLKGSVVAPAIVLALPRGGVPVAAEVARALGLPLDVLCVRKLGVPGHKELAFGAIAEGGGRVLNVDVIRDCRVCEDEISAVEQRERQELERRTKTYRAHPLVLEPYHTVVLVDDGLATGATMRAAINSLKQARVHHAMVAVPVAPRETLAVLETEADQVVCLQVPEFFGSVGYWYERFPQVGDDEVRATLQQAMTSSA